MGILGGGSTSAFDKQLESATSQLQLEPNWQAILDICDIIRQRDVPVKYAVQSIKRKAFDKNPHVSKFALVVLEACMKNCGSLVHDEVSSKEFMDDLRSLAKNGSAPVKEQVLTLLQAWNNVFRNKPNYKIFQDTYNLMKMEGYEFPPVSENDAMFSAESAPEWAEGDVCNMCRVRFSTFTRQHHCRCCGQVFCSKCSSKSSIIPKFGIEKEVRVCDPCYDSINPQGAQGSPAKTKAEDGSDLPSEYLNHPLSKEAQVKPKTSEDELKAQEEEDLQLAMALSLSAQENGKGSQGSKKWSSLSAATSAPQSASAPPAPYQEARSDLYSDVSSKLSTSSDSSDPELSRYLNRSYWEQKKQEKIKSEPSAPLSNGSEDAPPARTQVQRYVPGSSDNEEDGSDVFVQTMRNSLSMFVERMQSVTAEGKHIAMDTSVQSLFQSLSAMHPQLMRLVEEQEDQKVKYEAMLNKIALIREARESLDDVRAQHKEKLRQQELEQEMLRRMQMEQKLELMRQQKQEYLEYQHQLQIQRQQDLEAQQQIKLQQKQMMQQQGIYPYPQGAEEVVSSQYPGYNQYQTPAQYITQDGSQVGLPPGSVPSSETSSAYAMSGGYGTPQYVGGPAYPGQAQGPGAVYVGAEGVNEQGQKSQYPMQQQSMGISPSHRPALQTQDNNLKSVVPTSSNYEADRQLGVPSVQGIRPVGQPQPQPLSIAQQYVATQQPQSSRASQVPTSNLLDAPITSEIAGNQEGYSQASYGMSGPNSQDFNQPSYNQPTSQPPQPGQFQGQPGYTDFQNPQQYGQQQAIPDTQGQQHTGQYLQGQRFQTQQIPPPSAQPQQQQQTRPVHSSPQQVQPQPLQQYTQQARFGQSPIPIAEQQGHVSPQTQQRGIPQQVKQSYPMQQPQQDPRGGVVGPTSLQYLGPQDQMALHRGPSSMPPNINAYANYRPQENVQQTAPYNQQQQQQQQQLQQQQQQQQLQQQHLQQQQQLPYGVPGGQQGFQGQPAPEPQQNIPANSHLHDMTLISFD